MGRARSAVLLGTTSSCLELQASVSSWAGAGQLLRNCHAGAGFTIHNCCAPAVHLLGTCCAPAVHLLRTCCAPAVHLLCTCCAGTCRALPTWLGWMICGFSSVQGKGICISLMKLSSGDNVPLVRRKLRTPAVGVGGSAAGLLSSSGVHAWCCCVRTSAGRSGMLRVPAPRCTWLRATAWQAAAVQPQCSVCAELSTCWRL